MQRFYTPDAGLGDKLLKILDTDLIHQIAKVFRAKLGDQYIFFSGDGWEYTYTLTSLERNSLSLTLAGKEKNNHKSSQNLTVYQSFPNKWDKCELIAQKLTEIGVSTLIFFASDRSQVHEIPEKKRTRLNKIIIEATEQSGRPSLMNMEVAKGSPQHLENTIVLDFGGISTREILSQDIGKDVSLVVGPEGGWSEDEREAFRKQDTKIWSLGDSVLRTETASICASFCLLQK